MSTPPPSIPDRSLSPSWGSSSPTARPIARSLRRAGEREAAEEVERLPQPRMRLVLGPEEGGRLLTHAALKRHGSQLRSGQR